MIGTSKSGERREASRSHFGETDLDGVMKCIHCGLCLDSCPTYRVLGTEQDSPRGRLLLMRSMWEGKLPLDKQVTAPLERCLDCRACESVCPSQVDYGGLLEKTRWVLNESQKHRLSKRIQKRLFDWAFSGGRATTVISKVGRLAKHFGLQKLPKVPLLGKMMPKSWVAAINLMPDFEGASFKKKYGEAYPDFKDHSVSLFTGCVMDVADHEIHHASVSLLKSVGYRVNIPQEQVCCGALHNHQGFKDAAIELAQKNHAVLSSNDNPIVVNAAGCAAQLKTYGGLCGQTSSHMFNEEWAKRIKDVASALFDSPQMNPDLFIAEPEIEVLYDAPCHLIHAQKSDETLRKVLSKLPGVKLVPIEDAERCCGAGGIFNLKKPELAGDVLQSKMKNVLKSMEAHKTATILLTANPGCLYQLRAGARNHQFPIKVMHTAVFMASRLKAKKSTS